MEKWEDRTGQDRTGQLEDLTLEWFRCSRDVCCGPGDTRRLEGVSYNMDATGLTHDGVSYCWETLFARQEEIPQTHELSKSKIK